MPSCHRNAATHVCQSHSQLADMASRKLVRVRMTWKTNTLTNQKMTTQSAGRHRIPSKPRKHHHSETVPRHCSPTSLPRFGRVFNLAPGSSLADYRILFIGMWHLPQSESLRRVHPHFMACVRSTRHLGANAAQLDDEPEQVACEFELYHNRTAMGRRHY